MAEHLLGRGSPTLMSMAGQMMEWKRTISLPTMWTSAGQYFSLPSRPRSCSRGR